MSAQGLISGEELEAELARVEAERDAYRKALWRIGNSESGHWGIIARDVLAEQGATHA